MLKGKQWLTPCAATLNPKSVKLRVECNCFPPLHNKLSSQFFWNHYSPICLNSCLMRQYLFWLGLLEKDWRGWCDWWLNHLSHWYSWCFKLRCTEGLWINILNLGFKLNLSLTIFMRNGSQSWSTAGNNCGNNSQSWQLLLLTLWDSTMWSGPKFTYLFWFIQASLKRLTDVACWSWCLGYYFFFTTYFPLSFLKTQCLYNIHWGLLHYLLVWCQLHKSMKFPF